MKTSTKQSSQNETKDGSSRHIRLYWTFTLGFLFHAVPLFFAQWLFARNIDVASVLAITSLTLFIFFTKRAQSSIGNKLLGFIVVVMGVLYTGIKPYFHGGFNGLSLSTASVIPIYAACLIGPLSSIISGILLVIVVMGYYYLAEINYPFPEPLTIDFNFVLLSRLIYQIVSMSILGWLYEGQWFQQYRQVNAELVEAKDKAQAANEAKSLFLANMNHELRTPLNGVIGAVNMLLSTQLSSEQEEYVRILLLSSANLEERVLEILDFSKIESKSIALESVPFDLYSSIHEVVEMINIGAAKKKLVLIYDVAPNVPRIVFGDPVRLRQVVSNLLNNAVKFTQDGEIIFTISVQYSQDTTSASSPNGRYVHSPNHPHNKNTNNTSHNNDKTAFNYYYNYVKREARARITALKSILSAVVDILPGNEGHTNKHNLDHAKQQKTGSASLLHGNDSFVTLQFEVLDTGVGIDDAKLKKLFQPFTQADNSITRKFGGTGLGLSIAKQLVKLMGGAISVKSQRGKGSLFMFAIPFKTPATSIPLPNATPMSAPTASSSMSLSAANSVGSTAANGVLNSQPVSSYAFESTTANTNTSASCVNSEVAHDTTTAADSSKESSAHNANQSYSDKPNANLENKGVLLLSENFTKGTKLSAVLELWGMSVTLACDPDAACYWLNNRGFDVFMFDDEVQGSRITELISIFEEKAYEGWKHTQHIVMLGILNRFRMSRVELQKITCVVTKPIDVTKLEELLVSVIRKENFPMEHMFPSAVIGSSYSSASTASSCSSLDSSNSAPQSHKFRNAHHANASMEEYQFPLSATAADFISPRTGESYATNSSIDEHQESAYSPNETVSTRTRSLEATTHESVAPTILTPPSNLLDRRRQSITSTIDTPAPIVAENTTLVAPFEPASTATNQRHAVLTMSPMTTPSDMISPSKCTSSVDQTSSSGIKVRTSPHSFDLSVMEFSRAEHRLRDQRLQQSNAISTATGAATATANKQYRTTPTESPNASTTATAATPPHLIAERNLPTHKPTSSVIHSVNIPPCSITSNSSLSLLNTVGTTHSHHMKPLSPSRHRSTIKQEPAPSFCSSLPDSEAPVAFATTATYPSVAESNAPTAATAPMPVQAGRFIARKSSISKSASDFALNMRARSETATKPLVLLVEDNEINQRVGKHFLEKLNCEVKIADNGLDALRFYGRNEAGYKLILMDLEIPEMDGLTATREIRKVEKHFSLQRIPIYAVTAHAIQQMKDQVQDCGMDGFITKPVNFQRLKQTIDDLKIHEQKN